MNVMGAAKNDIKTLNKLADVDNMRDVMDDLAEMREEAAERGEFFEDIANEDNEELLGELDELEAGAIAGKMTLPTAGVGVI